MKWESVGQSVTRCLGKAWIGLFCSLIFHTDWLSFGLDWTFGTERTAGVPYLLPGVVDTPPFWVED
jgi:hypothetical protein